MSKGIPHLDYDALKGGVILAHSHWFGVWDILTLIIYTHFETCYYFNMIFLHDKLCSIYYTCKHLGWNSNLYFWCFFLNFNPMKFIILSLICVIRVIHMLFIFKSWFYILQQKYHCVIVHGDVSISMLGELYTVCVGTLENNVKFEYIYFLFFIF